MEHQTKAPLSQQELEDLVIQNDTGARKPNSKLVRNTLFWLAIAWSLFQLWTASPLQYVIGASVMNDSQVRIIHLAFAFALVYLTYPAWRWSPRNRIPLFDWVLAIAAVGATLYLFVFDDALAQRAGSPADADIYASAVGLVLLLIATFRALGISMVIIATIFLFYMYFGSADFIPQVIQHKGASLNKIAEHMWLSTEGVFGIPLGVAASFVFLFVLFGALLDKAGAGNFFTQLSFAMLGHMRGGPAKAAVLSSGLNGVVSGSSIANVVTSGVFTIPLMRRVGYSAEKASAIEVSSSVNGQIMPPVMGAAAFIMVEYVGIPYTQIVKHAFLPAVVCYIGLLYLVHLEALKYALKPLPRPLQRTMPQSLLVWGITASSFFVACGAIYYAVTGVDKLFGQYALFVLLGLIGVVYTATMWFVSQQPDLAEDDPNAPVLKLPLTWPTFKTGLHYMIPLVVLIWCLMVEFLSAGLSAFWAVVSLIFIVLTQKAFKHFFRKTGTVARGLKEGWADLLQGMADGARNMTAISIACATAGIVVGMVSQTGLSHVMADLVEYISGDSVLLMLIFTAIMSLILGMGLPTTVNYVVVASIMANVIVVLGAKNGLIVPLIAVHMFVFYFGIMADVTPPVGLASFAAAAISGTNPITVGIQAFYYNIRTGIIPFFFIYNTELLLIGVDSVWHGIYVFIKSAIAVMVFCAATQGYFLVRSRWYESVMLVLISVTLFIPNFVRDLVDPPYQRVDQNQVFERLNGLQQGSIIRLSFEGENHEGKAVQVKSFMEIKAGATAEEKLKEFGLVLREDRGRIFVDDVLFSSQAYTAKIDFDYQLVGLKVPKEQMNFRLFNIPAILLLLVVLASQTVRLRRQKALESIQKLEAAK